MLMLNLLVLFAWAARNANLKIDSFYCIKKNVLMHFIVWQKHFECEVHRVTALKENKGETECVVDDYS